MAKIRFIYAAMNSGKSTMLLQTAFNYKERGMEVIMFLPKLIGTNLIVSRIGLQHKAIVFDANFNFFDEIKKTIGISCVLIDEAQFLSKEHVLQLCRVCDELNIPILCYGLRSDFKGEPFEGSKYLLTLADELVELKTICVCNKKAIMNMRKVKDTSILSLTPVLQGDQVEIGGNDKYISLCRKCYFDIASIY
jgi:thymidine kinase